MACRRRARPAHRADAFLQPFRRVLHPRYDAMEAAFDARGDHGRRMMCNTAALQVNVDPGPDPAARWRLAHASAPRSCVSPTPFGGRRGPPERLAGQPARHLVGIDPSRTGCRRRWPRTPPAWRDYAWPPTCCSSRGDGTAPGPGDGHATPVTGSFLFARWMAEATCRLAGPSTTSPTT